MVLVGQRGGGEGWGTGTVCSQEPVLGIRNREVANQELRNAHESGTRSPRIRNQEVENREPPGPPESGTMCRMLGHRPNGRRNAMPRAQSGRCLGWVAGWMGGWAAAAAAAAHGRHGGVRADGRPRSGGQGGGGPGEPGAMANMPGSGWEQAALVCGWGGVGSGLLAWAGEGLYVCVCICL